MFQGIYTAIITPFRDGKVDEKKVEELVAFQVEAGVPGIVACGTTGESLFLSKDEQKRILEICATVCKGKAQLIAATGALSAEDTITNTHQAQKAGADVALIINPWYVKQSQESIYQHYKKISENVDLPILLYNNPTRTGMEISLETIVRLASFKNIQGLKDATSCLKRVSELKRQLGNQFQLFDGNDDTLAAFLAMGGNGGIMNATNVAPSLFVTLIKAWKENDLSTFKTTWQVAFPLVSALALESNPAPIKYAMTLVHGVSIESRMPFAPLSPKTQEAIEAALSDLGLWKSLAVARER